MALADTVIPSIRGRGQPNSMTDKIVPAIWNRLHRHWQHRHLRRIPRGTSSDTPNFKIAVQRLFSEFVPEEGKSALSFILNALTYAPSPLSSQAVRNGRRFI